MTRTFRLGLAAASLAALTTTASAQWQAAEQVEHYAISGKSGIELYQSIGENGPKAGIGRAIAFTDFKLLWSRDYRPQPDGSCVLATARPSLTITYRLPKPRGDLPEPVRTNWKTFIDGVTAHEKVHGEMIVDLVKAIEATSIGLSAPNDPGCQKVRAELQSRLGPLSQAQRARSRDFDRAELSEGGNVHQLVLNLANGG
ncbi:DUF922 domain-containing protein [Mesorhizobium sp. CAU 1732]|uniref:DUF922 domain-containing Zn-dependent protease n=1 Tax=Mesorhizobium sp. CAU 1732 TaxID=3140358 RepID=UPI0032611CE5